MRKAPPIRYAAKARRCVPERYLKTGGTITVIEGDHGSAYFHPETPEAVRAWRCLIEVQAALGGDSLIGRRLYPLLADTGFRDIAVSPRVIYCDQSLPAYRDGFAGRTIAPMVEGQVDPSLRVLRLTPTQRSQCR